MRKLFLILMTVMACTWTLSAQTRTIHGTVLDAANNEPLIGATIMPVGGGQGAAADLDGKFTLTVPAKVTKATVSYVGYKTVTVALSDNMTVRLESSAKSLDDVVVVAYGTANKESLTGSVAVVGAKDIENRPVTSATAALEGNAPGVQVNNTVGSPGSSPDIRIRGFNSINGVNSPLYVVDGIIFEGAISDINPQDIESMSVLKDAASAALYGNRAANGVILITTRKAKGKGKVDVNLSIRQGWYNRGIPEYDRLGPNDWMQTAFNAKVNGLLSNPDAPMSLQDAINTQRTGFISGFAGVNIYGGDDTQLFDENGKFLGKSPLAGYNDLDWWDAIGQTGYRQEYNINAAAASDKYNIFASIGYLKEKGYIVRTDYERFNARINANFNPTSYLRFGVNLAATQNNTNQTQIDADNLGLVTNPFLVMFKAPIYPYYSHDTKTGEVNYKDGYPVWNTAGYLENNNIAWSLREDVADNDALVVDGTIYGTAIIPYGFELTVKGSMHRDKTHFKSYSSNLVGSAEDVGALQNNYAKINTHTFMQTLNWAHDYGVHHVDVLLDHENWSYDYTSASIYKNYQMFPKVYYLTNFEKTQSANESLTEMTSESYLGRARYNYDQKYFAEFSIRRDGTSKFTKDNRWGTFWSVGASWVISKEKFMQSLTWIDYLKLRAAYGSVGNNASASAYAYWSMYGNVTPYEENGALVPFTFAAQDVKWEATKTLDVALEGTLFNDRFNFSIGYFNKQNSDLLFNVSQAASVGMTLVNGKFGSNARVLQNIGDMINWGWELSFSGDVIRTKDWRWGLSLDMTFYKNKITKLPFHHSIVGAPTCRTEGKSMYEFYMYDWAGVDRLTGQSLYRISSNSLDYIEYDANNKEVFSNTKYEDNLKKAKEANALVVIDGQYYTTDTNYASRRFCGSAIPTVYGSFGTTLSWKGINLSALFTYSLGGKVLDSNYASLMNLGSVASALHKDLLKSWTHAPEGMTADSPNRIDHNGIPQLNDLNNSKNNASTSSRFLTDASYLVFKNLNISYDFPKKWVNPLKLQNLNLGFSVDNLFTATKRKGMNPQYSWSGGQGAYFVTARVFTFQLTAKF